MVLTISTSSSLTVIHDTYLEHFHIRSGSRDRHQPPESQRTRNLKLFSQELLSNALCYVASRCLKIHHDKRLCGVVMVDLMSSNWYHETTINGLCRQHMTTEDGLISKL